MQGDLGALEDEVREIARGFLEDKTRARANLLNLNAARDVKLCIIEL